MLRKLNKAVSQLVLLCAICTSAVAAPAATPEWIPNTTPPGTVKWMYEVRQPRLLPGFILPVYLSLPNRPFETIGWLCIPGAARLPEDAKLDPEAIKSLTIAAASHGGDALLINGPAAPKMKCSISGTVVRWKRPR